jgi:murein DD-endopeptidase MepM/ murein hydrolase activator NlpD
MKTNNKQDELFIINDINMEINPSDVQVMDDNWVMEDSYLRSKAVFCYRSKYSATKVVLSIPFQVTHLNEVEASTLNNTYNCIRLITELSSYPFCFIRNQRIRTYISPTSISETGYMMFAVDEINLVQDAAASNMLFLEVVLQYFNHKALIRDFEFKSNLTTQVVTDSEYGEEEDEEIVKKQEKTSQQKYLDKVFTSNKKVEEQKRLIEVPNQPCSSLQESAVWKQYMRPKESKVYEELIRTGLLQTSATNTKSIHPSMRVNLMAPLMFVINEDEENLDDGRLVGEDCKVITVTNVGHYDNGSYENLLATLSNQDFSSDSVFENRSTFSVNSENEIKQGELTTQDSRKEEAKKKENTAPNTNPLLAALKGTKGLQSSVGRNGKGLQSSVAPESIASKVNATNEERDNPNKDKSSLSGGSSVFIQWHGGNVEDLQMGITSIKVSRKNKLVSHQISSFKHPIIQYMGKYPSTVSISMNSVNQDVYKNDESYNTNVFIKQVLNVLDFNKSNIPEAEAYNFLKVRSLATLVMGCENYVPSQSVVSASANQQGVENIVYSFNETDMTSFIEDTKVRASGKLSTGNATAKVTEMSVRWLTEFTKIFPDIMNSKNPSETYMHSLKTFKSIVELAIAAYNDLGFEKNKINDALETMSSLLPELQPGQNIIKGVELLPKDLNPKDLVNGSNLYTEGSKEIVETKENPNWNPDVKIGGSGKFGEAGSFSGSGSTRLVVDKVTKNPNFSEASLYKIYSGFIPFMVKTLLTRQSAQEGKVSTNIPGIKLNKSGRFDNLAITVVSNLEAALKNGEQAAAQSIDSTEVRTFFEEFSEFYAQTFFGYNYEDLSLEDLSPTEYDRNTDLLVQSIDPFFFLIERNHLDGTELANAYEQMYAQTGNLEIIPEKMNKQDETAKDNPDATALPLPVDYRQLKEIEYNKITPDTFMLTSVLNPSPADLGVGNGKNITIKQPYVDAIEKALKHYGYDKDDNFRKLVYSFLHIESANGTDPKAFDSEGAQGLFQLTNGAMTQLMMINNKVIDSQGNPLPSGRDKAWAASQAPSQRPKLRTDHFFNACCGIEYLLYIRKNYGNSTLINGQQNPVLLYLGYNLGPGSLEQLYSVISGKSSSAPAAIEMLKQQGNVKGVIWNGNHKETIESYIKVLTERSFSHNNVPKELQAGYSPNAIQEFIGIFTNAPESKKSYPTLTKLANNIFTKANEKVQGTTIPQNNANVKKVDQLYSNFVVTPTKADTVNFVEAGRGRTGVIVGRHAATTEDGDTLDFVDGKTGERIQIRLYGIDTPETTHLGEVDKKTLKQSEIGVAEILGNKAKEEMTRMAFGKTVSIIDMDPDTTGTRHVAKIVLPDGVDPALTLLRNGLGFVPDKFTSNSAYKKAEQEAKDNNRGIWKLPNGVAYKPRQFKTDGRLLTDDQVDKAKAQNTLRFTEADLDNASKVNGVQFNNYQPVAGGPFRTESPFGNRKGGGGVSKNHKGIDIKCPAGTKVVAAASGFAKFKSQVAPQGKPSFGYYIEIDHGNGFLTRYAHLSKSLISSAGKRVQAGEHIGFSGGVAGKEGSGSSTGAHLHYEVRYKGKPINPYGTKLLTEYKAGDPVGQGNNTAPPISSKASLDALVPKAGVTPENTVYNEDELAKAIFQRMNKYVNLGLKTSLPAIKVYVTIGNENDKFWLNTLKGGIQYYELKGIKSFSMACNNDVNPVDVVVMDIADPSFLNTDAFMGLKKMQGISPNKIGTDYETQFSNDNILLRAGLKLHIRLGYGNNISKLDVVFNGTITDINISNPQNVQVICEGFGKELLGEIFGPVKPVMLNSQDDHMSTAGVIGESLLARCITHFGYSSGFWADKFQGLFDPEDRSLAPGTFSFSYNWFFDKTPAQYRSRIYSNIFAPEIEAVDQVYRDGEWFSHFTGSFSGLYMQGYPFSVYRMTPWDCLKQMEYRHPNTIMKPKFYEDRMTMFYGIKEQMYFAKDINRATQMNSAKEIEGGTLGFSTQTYYEHRRERMSPAVDMHLVTSSHNLISNGLRLNSTYATVTNVAYSDSRSESIAAKPWEMENQKIKMDDNIFSWDLREKNLTLSSCVSKYMAFCYGTTDLKKEAEKMYSGKILVVGNPTIKAGDYVFLDDSEKRMLGLVLVRECTHHFDDKRGFITEIVPGQYVEAANFLYSSLWFKLICCSKIATSKLRNISKENFTAKDFNMVYDLLTIMNQLHIASDKPSSFPIYNSVDNAIESPDYALATRSVSALSIYVTTQLAGILGVKPHRFGTVIGAGTGRYIKAFYELFPLAELSDWKLLGKDVAHYLKVTDAVEKINGKITGTKQLIGGSKYAAYAKKAKASFKDSMAARSAKEVGLVGKAFRFTGKLLFSPIRFAGVAAGHASLIGAKVLARAMVVGLIALPVAGLAAVAIDVIITFALQWAFDKMEENKLIRQPLLLYPLVRHGKPYTAGMAGLKRNSWWESNKEELGKTIDQAKKSANIIAENGKLAGSEQNLFIQMLNWYGDGKGEERNAPITYSTNLKGNKIELNSRGEPKVVTSEDSKKLRALEKAINAEVEMLSKEEKKAEELKDQLKKVTSKELGRSTDLPIRNPK